MDSIPGEKKVYEKNISLEKTFAECVKAILGRYFFTQDVKYDQQYATDFVIFKIPDKEISVGLRLRRYQYFLKYPLQFTIRWSLPSGVKTEIHKIREGLVNYILYGFVDEQEKKLLQYFIADLDVFRLHEPTPIGIFNNIPPDSKLAAYNVTQFPKEFILKWYPLRFTK